jgi:hypothetical protein
MKCCDQSALQVIALGWHPLSLKFKSNPCAPIVGHGLGLGLGKGPLSKVGGYGLGPSWSKLLSLPQFQSIMTALMALNSTLLDNYYRCAIFSKRLLHLQCPSIRLRSLYTLYPSSHLPQLSFSPTTRPRLPVVSLSDNPP